MTLSLEAHQATQTPSKWTLLQRRLFDAIGDAAPQAQPRRQREFVLASELLGVLDGR